MANVIGGKLAAVGNIQISNTAAMSAKNRPARNAVFTRRVRHLLNKIDRGMSGYLGSLAEARVRAPHDHS